MNSFVIIFRKLNAELSIKGYILFMSHLKKKSVLPHFIPKLSLTFPLKTQVMLRWDFDVSDLDCTGVFKNTMLSPIKNVT